MTSLIRGAGETHSLFFDDDILAILDSRSHCVLESTGAQLHGENAVGGHRALPHIHQVSGSAGIENTGATTEDYGSNQEAVNIDKPGLVQCARQANTAMNLEFQLAARFLDPRNLIKETRAERSAGFRPATKATGNGMKSSRTASWQ